MTDREDRLVGKTIDGRFRLERLIGAGGMGKVYYGVQLSVERPVAVKILRQDLSDIPSLQQRFFREAKVVASLRHPNVVGLVDFGRDDDVDALYMAMEFVDGRSLADTVSAGRLPLSLALSIARQICAGLAEAHAAGIVHRDLKPDNVMLQTTAEGTLVAKILDFGIALPTGKDETRFTATGAIVGTPYYMSPEQAQDMPVSVQSDIYSVGVILYEMITGTVPFTGDTPLAVLFKTVNERHTPVQELLDSPRLGGPFGELIDTLLEKDPANRPVSASDVARRLDELRSGLDVPNMESIETLETVVQPALVPPAPVPAVPVASADPRPDPAAPPTGSGAPKGGQRSQIPAAVLVAVVVGIVALVVVSAMVLGGIFLLKMSAPDSGPTAQAPRPAAPKAKALAEKPRPAAPSAPESKPEPPASKTPPPKRNQPKKPEPAPPKPKPKPKPKPPKNSADDVERKRRTGAGGSCQGRTCAISLTTKDAHYACQSKAKCSVDCLAGGCGQVCQSGATCTFDCSGGGCSQRCFAGTTCILSCQGGDCDRVLLGDANVTELD